MVLIELFAGIGSQTQAFKNLGVKHTSYISEWNINSIISYDAIHTDDFIDYTIGLDKQEIISRLSGFKFSTNGKTPCDISRIKEDKLRRLYNANKRSKNLGSILDLEELPECDMVFHSSPCQDYSVAGNGKGGDEGSGTSSSLMWESMRLISKSKPKFVIWENVKNVLSKKHRHNFDKYIKDLEKLGYNSYYQVLNAKDYRIPQNRERLFCLSIKNDINRGFLFPDKKELKLILKDMLESEVNKKYYLKPEQYKNLLKNLPKLNVNPTKMMIKNATQQGYQEAFDGDGISLEFPNSKTRRGRVQSKLSPTLQCNDSKGVIVAQRGRYDENGKTEQRLEPRKDNITNTITTVQKDNYLLDKESLMIRKLTPKECWRLMGFKDEQFEKAEKVCSDSQLYKQAGNSIVVNVLVEIFKKMIEYGYL